ncbi:hypothetical protein [Streptomyces sp. NPDC127084]|uniref:hypothetical protein n=1 Tax=Streptomyces sp. NPDC127084 TaxID=3347133 RepID=UPI003662326E
MSSADQTPEQPVEPSSAAVPGPRPPRLTAAAAVCALEALALVVGGVYLLVSGLLGAPESTSQAESGGATLIALGVIPLLAARGLLLRRGWSRGPAIITQLMALPVAWTLLRSSGAMIPAGIALAVVALTGLALLLSPSTTRELGLRRG